jgi:hypothetical protein
MSGNKKDDEMICALTADEYTALQKGLRTLPETMPPRDVWQRIREQGEAEGLLSQRNVMQRPSTWYAGVGVAAAAVLAAVIVPGLWPQSSDITTVPTNAVTTSPVQLNMLQTLMNESRQLESSLRALPNAPAVQRASTMATIADLEDRIASIDYQLNDPSVDMSDEDRELFWRERVRLMKSLLQLRYAQAQRAAF